MTPTDRTADERDDHQRLAADHVIATEKLCALIGITANARVLDIGCGTGHAALAAARRRAIVTGIDLDEDSLARARWRAEAEALEGIAFVRADAAAMPFADASFDFVVSSLGIVFLPDQEAAARELARVVRPGGVIALTAHTRQSIPGQIYHLVNDIAENAAMPAHQHYEWAEGARAGHLLSPYFEAIHITYDSYDSCFASSAAWFDHVSRWNPNIRRIMRKLSAEKAQRLRNASIAVVDRHNRATNGTFMANMDYAVITAVRSG